MSEFLGKVRAYRVTVAVKGGTGVSLVMIVIAFNEDEAVAFAKAQARFEGYRPEIDGHVALEMFRSPLTVGVLTRLK